MNERIVVTDLGEVGERMGILVKEWPDIVRGAMFGSLAANYLGPVHTRVPKSEKKKYPPQFRSMYGNSNLMRSLFPSGQSNNPNDLTVHTDGTGISFSLGSSVEYAVKVHETAIPKEGHYWDQVTIGGRGWSTPRTGAKYLEKPYTDNEQVILSDFLKNVDKALKRRGVL